MTKEAVQMNKTTVIKYLEYSREIDDEVKIKRNIVEDLEVCYDTSAAVNYDGMLRGQNHISNPTEKAAINVPDYVRKEIREHKEDIEQLQKLKCEIVKEVLRLSLKQKQVIMMFYFQDLKWAQISDLLHYSERQCKNIRNEAIERLLVIFQNKKTIRGFRIRE